MRHLISIILAFLICCVIVSCTSVTGSSGSNTSDDFYSLLEQGKIYEDRGDADNAMLCYLSALDLLKEKQDTVLKVSAYTHLGDFHFRYGMYEKAVENHREGYNIAVRMNDDKLVCESTGRLGLDYLMLGQKDTAQYFMDRYHMMTSERGLQNLFENKYGLCPDNSGVMNLNSVINTVKQDSLGTLASREHLLSLESDFLHQRALLRKKETRMNNVMNISSGIFLFGVCSAMSFFFYRGRRKAENDLSNVVKINSDQAEYYIQRENDLCEQEKLLKVREELLLSETNVSAVTLINRMKSSPSYMPVKTESEWNNLFSFTESLYPGFSDSLDSTRELTVRDREICCLVKLGFTTGQMAVFYGISPGSVTKAKSRIQKKIRQVC